MATEGPITQNTGSITVQDGTRIFYKDWETGSRLSSATAGHSMPTPGTTNSSTLHRRAIAQSPTTAVATLKGRFNADLLAFLKS
jgi:hypothetical protein